MSCAACGGLLVDAAKFCPHCGVRVATTDQGSDPLRPLLEQALGTHYRVVRQLGRGGMGTVYLAHESGLDRDVAIKVLAPEKALSDVRRERFRREARIAARLSHANLVPLYAFGEHEGMAYYVMGYVEGESLAERLRREGRLPEAEARRILIAIADALHYAHTRDVVHRDVKPHNILLEEGSDRPMLTDFGISKLAAEASTLTATGIVVGTPDYMSPEQASGSAEIGPASDLYSLGVVGYAMLAGRLPFEGRTPGEVIVKRISMDAPPLPAGAEPVSRKLTPAVMRCLARRPENRWPDAGTFARVLAQPDDDEADDAPELATFRGSGLLVLALSYAALVYATLWRIAPAPGVPLELAGQIFPAIVALLLYALSAVAFKAHWRGHAFRAFARSVFEEPASWISWYPRHLRRPGNVWDRLPSDVRRLRLAAGILGSIGLVLFVPVAGLMSLAFSGSAGERLVHVWIRPVFFLLAWVMLGTMAFFLFFGWRVPARLKKAGLSEWEARRVAYETPLARASFWSRPAVAALLAPAVDTSDAFSAGMTNAETVALASGARRPSRP